MQYYYCVSCGLHEKFDKERTRGIKCHRCGYEDLTDIGKEGYDRHLEDLKRHEDLIMDDAYEACVIGEE